jgi:hypothetical protein
MDSAGCYTPGHLETIFLSLPFFPAPLLFDRPTWLDIASNNPAHIAVFSWSHLVVYTGCGFTAVCHATPDEDHDTHGLCAGLVGLSLG